MSQAGGYTTGKSGYAPACANEWRAGVCEKPAYQVRRLSESLVDPAFGRCYLRPLGRQSPMRINGLEGSLMIEWE